MESVQVATIEYGVGNLRSLRRGVGRSAATLTISDDPRDIAAADALILPGVGVYEECVSRDNDERVTVK